MFDLTLRLRSILTLSLDPSYSVSYWWSIHLECLSSSHKLVSVIKVQHNVFQWKRFDLIYSIYYYIVVKLFSLMANHNVTGSRTYVVMSFLPFATTAIVEETN